MDGDVTHRRSGKSPVWRILALMGVLAIVAVGAFLLGRGLPPHRVAATALFEVDHSTPGIMSDASRKSFDEQEFAILKKSQLALLKSNFVLTAALRDPKVGGLPMIQDQSDPVAWLQDHLEIEFPENGEILSISLPGSEEQTKELVPIVDAVAKAYREEVVSEQRMRQLASRDLVARSLENLNSEIKRKLDEYLDIARESGKGEGGSAQLLQQLGSKRLDRIEDEVMRLESEFAIAVNNDAEKQKVYEARIHQLREQADKLTAELTSRVERSADLEVRDSDLRQLQQIAHDMAVRLESMDIDASSPDRIR